MHVIVLASARRHGIADDDMLHAQRNAVRIVDQGDGMTMWIGPSCSGTLLEVGTINPADSDALLIAHAMNARPKYLR